MLRNRFKFIFFGEISSQKSPRIRIVVPALQVIQTCFLVITITRVRIGVDDGTRLADEVAEGIVGIRIYHVTGAIGECHDIPTVVNW